MVMPLVREAVIPATGIMDSLPVSRNQNKGGANSAVFLFVFYSFYSYGWVILKLFFLSWGK
jgi:hypothetical protein